MQRSFRSFLLMFALAVFLLVAGCGGDGSTSTSPKTNANAEKIAPGFTTVLLNGDKFSYESLKGKPLVLNFAASWCGPCELEAPILVRGYEKYKDRVQFFGLAVKDDLDGQKAFAAKHGLQFPIGMDNSGKISFDYQKASRVSISGIPTTYFIDSEGKIIDFYIGPLSDKTLDDKIAKILPADEDASTTSTQPTTGTQPTGTTTAPVTEPTTTMPAPAAPEPAVTVPPAPPETVAPSPSDGSDPGKMPATGIPFAALATVVSGLMSGGALLIRSGKTKR